VPLEPWFQPPGASPGCERSAFTLIELLIVLTILIVTAAAVMPRVVAYEESQRAKALEASIIRLPIEARNEAVKSQVPVRIRVDGDMLMMERMPLDITGTQQPQTVKQLSLGNDIQVENVQTQDSAGTSSSWAWTAYPDGSADTGGIQFVINSAEKSLVLPAKGDPQWVDGPLPDQTQQKWQAGSLATRSQ
jgi:prepilin-type N-terminal cleavage/methylation domain-containing protein